jgi:hypothetical protein
MHLAERPGRGGELSALGGDLGVRMHCRPSSVTALRILTYANLPDFLIAIDER